jgi:hypothetical protein
MLSTRNSRPEYPISLRPKTTIATKVFIVSALAVLALYAFTTSARAQSLSTGQLTNVTASSTACSGSHWFSYQGIPASCYTATVQNCPNTDNFGLTFAYLNPAGLVQNVPKTLGVIVFFNGGDGTDPGGDATGTPSAPLTMAGYYFSQGYEIVQTAWQYAWQETDAGQLGQLHPGNIQNAACRPATFLKWVYQNVYLPITQGTNGYAKAGMCAQGASAGSAQVAYSLAYYGLSSYLDSVELMSGPVLSDIEQGCAPRASGTP